MNKLLIAATCLLSFRLAAQTVLSPEEAVKISLQNNYNILVAANNAEADSVRNNAGQAGMLPTVYLLGGMSVNQNNLTQRFTNGNEITSPNAGGTSMNAGVALSWTLFDGMKMFVTKEKLGQIEMLGDLEFRTQVINTSADVLIAYYDVVRLNAQLKATDEIIRYNEERVKITEARLISGIGPKTDVLQAKIDLNHQKQIRLEQQAALAASKQNLNNFLSRDALTAFDVADSIVIGVLEDRAALEQKLPGNPVVMSLMMQRNITTLTYRETRTQYLPTITGNAGYNFTRSQNTAGFTLFNQAYGWNAGVTLSMPLYAAGTLRTQSQVNRIEIENAEYNLQNGILTARLALMEALNLYDSRMAALQLEQENKSLATENMQLSLDRLRLGQGTALEVAQAQATLADVLFRLAAIQFDAKSAEINVHRQAADL